MSYEKSFLHPQVHKVLNVPVMFSLSTFRDHSWVPYSTAWVIFLSVNIPVNQILVSLLWFCPFGRRHSSSLQSNFVVPKVMFSFLGLHGPPYAKVPIKWGLGSKWHISHKLRMVLFGMHLLHCSLMLKIKELHRMMALLYCFSILFCITFHSFRLCPCFSSLEGKIPSFLSILESFSSVCE